MRSFELIRGALLVSRRGEYAADNDLFRSKLMQLCGLAKVMRFLAEVTAVRLNHRYRRRARPAPPPW